MTVTDDNPIVSESRASFRVIGQGLGLSITPSVVHESCTTPNSGSIDIVSVTNGVPPYTYNWDNGATTPMISGLAGGNYNVTVTDANGCTTAQTINVQSGVNTSTVVDYSVTEPNCGQSNGSIDLSVSNTSGGGNFSYQWSNGSTSEDLSNLPAGLYEVTITDTQTACTHNRND